MVGGVVFRRIGGRIVPIKKNRNEVKPNKLLSAGAVGASIASGIISANSLIGVSRKTLFLGQSVSWGLDLASTSLNVSAHAGRNKLGQRAKMAGKDEIRNQSIGYGVFGAAILANPKARSWGVQHAKRGFSVVKSLLMKVR